MVYKLVGRAEKIIKSFCIFSESIMGNMRNGTLLLCILCICQLRLGGCTKDTNSNVGCIPSERRALMELRESLVDDANRLSSWTGEDCCTWDGITCNNLTGRVQKIDLHNPIQPYADEYTFDSYYLNNCLGGEINPSIISLEHLQYLDLSSNDFSGSPIPTFLGYLKNMRFLNLSGSGFSGEIPHQLGNLSNLQYLYLGDNLVSYNSLTAKSLRWIAGIASLKSLDLSGVNLNQCHDLLRSINLLPSLSVLKLRACRLAGTISPPLSLVNLTSLVSVDLGENQLNPTSLLWLFNLSSLSVLRLDANLLGNSITSMLGKLTALNVLDLSYNSLNSSSMPDSICNHTSLISLDLSYNQLHGSLPLCLGNLTSLEILNLRMNNFGGNLPSEIGHLRQLTDLDLSSNYFKCPIPSSLGELVKLKYLDLSGNQLNGTVPSTLGLLTKLRNLDISNNSLSGVLSESLFVKLKDLKLFSISENYFLTINVSSQWIPPFQLREIEMDSIVIGTQFPPWLQTQRNVAMLSMMNASICGTIPVWFKTFCSSVKYLFLSSNKIHGSLISFPLDLRELDLSNNFLTGPVSLFDDNYATNSSLRFLKLCNNHFSGNIPDYLCNLSSLGFLCLANNKLTGRIPPCFGNLRRLQVLDLANNSLSGHIPSTLGNLVNLIILHLDENKFYGVLPSSLKNLKFLLTLDLGENQLMDTIPEWIGKELSSLQFLRLESNKFHGNVSTHLCQLSSLQVLNLAQNNLVGQIPHCFGNFSMMLFGSKPLFDTFSEYLDILVNIVKGKELEYSSNLQYLKSISLSRNNLHGEIPTELMQLGGLQSLNLSHNLLGGRIPEKIGNLKQLESLDLASNEISGPIPQSLANIDTLSYLNLSFNNLSGSIPSGNHFQTLNDPSIFEGNSELCGEPLAKSCPDDTPSIGNGVGFDQRADDDGEFELPWFYAGIGPGVAVGLLGVICLLYFNKSWSHAYFKFVESVYHRVCAGNAMEKFQLERTEFN